MQNYNLTQLPQNELIQDLTENEPVNTFMEMNFTLPQLEPLAENQMGNVLADALTNMDSDNDFDMAYLMNIPFPTL